MQRGAAAALTLFLGVGCFTMGFKQITLGGTNQNLRGSQENYAKLEKAARDLGWPVERNVGHYDLTTHPAPGQDLVLTTNSTNGIMAYNCRGLGSAECREALVKILNPAFGLH